MELVFFIVILALLGWTMYAQWDNTDPTSSRPTRALRAIWLGIVVVKDTVVKVIHE